MLGIDLLGGAQYADAAAKAYASLPGYAVGLFWKQFGDARPLINKLIGAGCNTFRIHILWRYSHIYSDPKTEHEAVREFGKCLGHFRGKAGVNLYISLCCEHRLSAATMGTLIESAWDKSRTPEFQGCPVPKFVNTPANGVMLHSVAVKGKSPIPVINELHIPAGTPENATNLPGHPTGHYTVSPDGWTLSSNGAGNYNRAYGNALLRFAWNPKMNLHPSKPSAEEIVALGKLLQKN